MLRVDTPKPVTQPAGHILLAEDDEALRSLLSWALERRGYQVTECADGLDLLDHIGSFVLEEGDEPRYALVISDIRMPGMSGLEVLRGLKGYGKIPPVVLITAFGNPDVHDKARRYGAIALLDKPFEIADLVEIVERWAPLPKSVA